MFFVAVNHYYRQRFSLLGIAFCCAYRAIFAILLHFEGILVCFLRFLGRLVVFLVFGVHAVAGFRWKFFPKKFDLFFGGRLD
jgi:hypothetical protein